MKKLFCLLAASCAGLAAGKLAATEGPTPPDGSANPAKGSSPVRSIAAVPAVLDGPISSVSTLAKVDPSLLVAQGQVTVVIRLKDKPLALAVGPNARRQGAKLSPAQQRAYQRKLLSSQVGVATAVTQDGGRIIGRLTKALNAVIANVDAAALPKLAHIATVATIRPVGRYEKDLSETVPQIGAAIAHSLGFDGAGLRVAVLDSGIDYTHEKLGGGGTVPDYLAAYGAGPLAPENKALDGLFPTDKVIAGYDFVGEEWPRDDDDTELNPDPDPIDYDGHGTHVSDIIAGLNGVAPGAKLYAFKVCSAISTSCNGVAILQGLDAAADPDGNGDISDAADVVNLSLGLGYGQIQDDSAAAVQNLVEMGVVVVCSGGNNGDKPYVVGSPSIAPGAISVAQTHVASANAITLRILQDGQETQYPNTASIEWAPVTAEVSNELVYVGSGCPDNPATPDDEADPYLEDPAGKVALIDRGACNISLKVDRAAKAGAIGVILVNNVAGDPPTFSFGGGDTFVPTIVISQADGNDIKAKLASPDLVTATYSPDVGTSLNLSMVSISSRGPAPSNQAIKPDIGAPGASVSAEVGTGDGETAFGGTSGAAPMVAGAAALVLEAFPNLAPHEVKARLMNTAEKSILINPITLPGVLAPITRIGAGEVRVNQAIAAESIAYDRDTKIASLSFGYRSINGAAVVNTLRRTIEISNLGSAACTYTPANTFRYADDEATTAVAVSFTPPTVTIPAGQKGYIRMSLTVDGTKLPDWDLNGGPQGGDGERLRTLEYDGYVAIACDGQDPICLPWHILPRKAADVRSNQRIITLAGDPGEESGSFDLTNLHGSRGGTTEVFDLLGQISPFDYPTPPPAGANFALVDLKSFGARTFLFNGEAYVEFAVTTYGEPAHPNYPAGIEIDIDTTGYDENGNPDGEPDGEPEFAVYHAENGGFTATGQNVTVILDLTTGDASLSPFYTDCDLNSGAMVFTVPLSALGMDDLGYPMQIIVWGYDNYFTGFATDYIADDPFFIYYTPGVPRFYAEAETVPVPQGGTETVLVTRDPVFSPFGDEWSPSHSGLLLFHRQAATKRWTDEIQVKVPIP